MKEISGVEEYIPSVETAVSERFIETDEVEASRPISDVQGGNETCERALPKVAVFTLGCKVNLYDSDAMLAILKAAGFEVFEGLKYADIYILNTCAVTAEAEKKSRQALTRIRKINPDAQIYVCGCASQRDSNQFMRDGVRFVCGTDGKTALAREIAAHYLKGETLKERDFCISDSFEEGEGVVNLRTRHFIKVQDGCNNFCSYCIVPYLRGRSRSRSLQSILREIDGVCDSVHEAVITGINLSAYGKDTGTGLTELLQALGRYKDLRIRLGSLEAGVIDDDFLSAAKTLDKFCPHFHLSLQSGDDGVLSDMNRHYTCGEYALKVALIRKYFPGAAITTDIIVGFPTESEQQFENSLAFAERIGFADIHVFPYSSRQGTKAGRLKTLPPAVVEDRVKRMTALKKQLSKAYLSSVIGTPQEVLFECEENGLWVGHAMNYCKIYSEVGARNAIAYLTPQRLYLDGVIV